jgi:hypothetical protein
MQKYYLVIEQVGVAVRLQTCIREVRNSNLGWDTLILTEVLHSFLQSLRSNAWAVSQLAHNRFPPNRFQFIIHQ